jgi:hypothetical protein
MGKSNAARRTRLNVDKARPKAAADTSTEVVNSEAASTAAAAASTAEKAKQELKGEGTGRRGKRVEAQTQTQAGEQGTETATAPATEAEKVNALVARLRTAQLAGQVTQNPYAVRDELYNIIDNYPNAQKSILLKAASVVDPEATAKGDYNFLTGEAEAVGGEGGATPPPSAVADSGTQTNLQDGVVTSSDNSLPPVTDAQGELTAEEITARLQGMVGEATGPKIAVTSTKFPSYGDDATPLPRRAVPPTAEQAAANVAGEAAAADMDADRSAEIARLNAALDAGTATMDNYRRLETLTANAGDLDETDLQQIIGPIELDESVVTPPPLFQPRAPVPTEAQLGPRTEPAVPFPMGPISFTAGDSVPSQPLDLSGLTRDSNVEFIAPEYREGAEPIDVNAFQKALGGTLLSAGDGSVRSFEGKTPSTDGMTRSTPVEQFAVSSFAPFNAPFQSTSSTSNITFDRNAPRAAGTPVAKPAPQEAPQVPTTSIRKLIQAIRNNPLEATGLGAIAIGGPIGIGLARAGQQPPDEAQPVVNLSDEERELISQDPAKAIENLRKRNAARNTGAGGLMTNVQEDRP